MAGKGYGSVINAVDIFLLRIGVRSANETLKNSLLDLILTGNIQEDEVDLW